MTSIPTIVSAAYPGIPFPGCFYAFGDFARRLKRDTGIDLNDCALDIRLGEIFHAWEPDFDSTRFDPARQSRYPNDPPEFFTVIHGSSDGLHWGYYVENPGSPEPMIASYYHREPLRFSIEGLSLFEAVRLHLERCYDDALTYAELEPESSSAYRDAIAELDAIRAHLMRHATGDRLELGSRYAGLYALHRTGVIPTRDGIGLALDPADYQPLAGAEAFLKLRFTPSPQETARFIEEAQALLEQSRPGAVLKLGRDLWCYPEYRTEAIKLLQAAYPLLGREALLSYMD